MINFDKVEARFYIKHLIFCVVLYQANVAHQMALSVVAARGVLLV